MAKAIVVTHAVKTITKPSVSFIVPVLNGEKHIQRCLFSLRNLASTKNSYEIVILDNGSTDGTHKVIRALGFELSVESGVSVATLRNRGAATASGEYLAFVDADVELARDWLQHGIASFRDRRIVAVG